MQKLPTMDKHLNILLLEDSKDDVELISRELRRGGLEFSLTVVKKKEDYQRALFQIKPDVILSDHSLPQFNSIEAMEIWKLFQKECDISVPFILVTGSVSEEFAVQTIKAGAQDYILKDRLKRLPTSIRSALEKLNTERERSNYLSEVIAQSALMKEAERLANFGSWQIDLNTGKHQWSDQTYRILGFSPGEVAPDYEKYFANVHPDDKNTLEQDFEKAIATLPFHECEYRITDEHQRVKHIYSKILVRRDAAQHPYQVLGFILDITAHKKQTSALEMQNQRLMEIAWVQSHQVRGPLARLMGLVQLLTSFPDERNNLKETLSHILQSAAELDEIVRRIVRKTEEIT